MALAATGALVVAGCTHTKLERSTIHQASTLADLQYAQVLNNLAMFCDNPSALPYHINLRDGSAQVADLESGTIGSTLGRSSNASPSLLGSRTVVEQWGMTPVTDDTELKILRVAYRRAIGIADSLEGTDRRNELADDLAHELKKQTQDLDEFQNDIKSLLADSRSKYQSDKIKELLGYQLPLGKMIQGKFSPEQVDTVADVLVPFKYSMRPFSILAKDQTSLYENYTYQSLRESSLSVVQAQIVLPSERLGDEKFVGEDDYEFSMFRVDPMVNRMRRSQGLVEVKFITPFAAEVRRQVKEVQDDLLEIGPGWYHVGCKKDVPKDACYVGHYRDCYVWVGREGLEGLTQFTLKILNFSSLIKDATILTTPGPRFTPSSSFPSL